MDSVRKLNMRAGDGLTGWEMHTDGQDMDWLQSHNCYNVQSRSTT